MPMVDGSFDRDLGAAEARLVALLRELGSVLVTFSGGVDSTLLLAFAVETLGSRALAWTATSETLLDDELAAAQSLAAGLGATHHVESSRELEKPAYQANRGDRCYHCKTELFDLARAAADRLGVRWVVDGTIVDDLGEHRPGLRAATEHAVRHPLVEAGFDKAMVRALAKSRGLQVWDKPAAPCLGSRFAVGTQVTLERVRRVAGLERFVRGLGARVQRVRVHAVEGGELARIELGAEEQANLPGDAWPAIHAEGRRLGFLFVTLDLGGYRRGSTSGASS